MYTRRKEKRPVDLHEAEGEQRKTLAQIEAMGHAMAQATNETNSLVHPREPWDHPDLLQEAEDVFLRPLLNQAAVFDPMNHYGGHLQFIASARSSGEVPL